MPVCPNSITLTLLHSYSIFTMRASSVLAAVALGTVASGYDIPDNLRKIYNAHKVQCCTYFGGSCTDYHDLYSRALATKLYRARAPLTPSSAATSPMPSFSRAPTATTTWMWTATALTTRLATAPTIRRATARQPSRTP